MTPEAEEDLAVLALISWSIVALVASPMQTARMLAGGSYEDAPPDPNVPLGQWPYGEYWKRINSIRGR